MLSDSDITYITSTYVTGDKKYNNDVNKDVKDLLADLHTYKQALELACSPVLRQSNARIYDSEYWLEQAQKEQSNASGTD